MDAEDKAARELVRQFIMQNFILEEGAVLADDDSFVEQGIVDSTGILELVLFLEQTFGLNIPDQDITPDNLDSVDKVCAYLARQRAAQPLVAGAQPAWIPTQAL